MGMWVLVQIVSPIFAIGYVLVFSTYRFSSRVTYMVAGGWALVLTMLNVFAVSNLYPVVEKYPEIDIIYRIFNITSVGLVGVTLNRKQKAWTARLTFGGLSVCLAVFVLDTIAITIRTVFGLYPMELLCELLLYPLMLLAMIRLRKPFFDVTLYMKNRILPLCLVPVSLIIAFFMQVSFPVPLERAPENIPVALMLCGVTVTAYGVIVYLFRTILAQNHMEQSAQAMQLYVSALENQNELVRQNARNTALFRHDLRHAIQMMSVCVENEDMDGVRELLGSLDRNVSEGINVSMVAEVTGHRLLDATLSYHVNMAKEAGIDILVDMERMDHVKADKAELAVVLSNALENAIYACKNLPETELRAVRVHGCRHGAQFFLEIANTYAGAVTFHPETGLPVGERPGHGLGSQSIAFFAHKFGAVLEYLQSGGWFFLRLLL